MTISVKGCVTQMYRLAIIRGRGGGGDYSHTSVLSIRVHHL